MIFWIADDGNAAAVAEDGLALRHGVNGVIGTLAVDVGFQRQQQGRHGWLRKYDDVIHAAQGCHEFRTILFAEDWTASALQTADGSIVIDGNHQPIRFGGGSLQIANMTDVQQVEAAVCERHGTAGGAILGDRGEQGLARKNSAHIQAGRPMVPPLIE